MRRNPLTMLALALIFGAGAVFAARAYIETDRFIEPALADVAPQATIVVAASGLGFGARLATDSLREIPWMGDALPQGAFATRRQLLADGERFAMTAIGANTPVLAADITGPDQRATLSSLVTPGMKAVTIRVNDVLGVAGFVLPGDRVDILLTRSFRARSDEARSHTDVLIQGVKVLAIDQHADKRTDEPVVAKAVTLEVSTEQAQKLTLGADVGQLSLALRHVAEGEAEETRRITLADLGLEREVALPEPAAPAPATAPAPAPRKAEPSKPRTITVVHGIERTEHTL